MRTLIFTFLSLICFYANAVKVTDLYRVDLPIQDTTKETLSQAQKDALSEVFIRVSGQKNILANEKIQQALKSASRFVTGEMQHQEGTTTVVTLDFSDAEVAKALASAKASLWGSNRPQILIWQVTHKGKKAIEWDQQSDTYTKAIKRQAEYRGLPVTFPTGDLEDINSVSVSDIWGDFNAPVIESSQRYAPDSLLINKLVYIGSKKVQPASNANVPPLLQDPAQASTTVALYRLTWQFYDQTPASLLQDSVSMMKARRGQFTGTLEGVYSQLFDMIADDYATRYALSLSGQSISSFELEVENVKTKSDYYKLERILKAMSSVQSFYPTYADGEVMEVKVLLKTSSQNFMRELKLSSQLKRVDTDVTTQDGEAPTYTHLRLR